MPSSWFCRDQRKPEVKVYDLSFPVEESGSVRHAWFIWIRVTNNFSLLIPCRYRQKSDFTGSWEPTTPTRRQESVSSGTRTRRLMKRPIAQHGGACMGSDGSVIISRTSVYIHNFTSFGQIRIGSTTPTRGFACNAYVLTSPINEAPIHGGQAWTKARSRKKAGV